MPKAQTPNPTYVPLEVTSNFSFLRAGSHPEELVMGAAALGLPAIAIADRNSLAGVVRAHIAVKEMAKGSGMRSEEHTSELQSLMRISYAVFCLKKKKKQTSKKHTTKKTKQLNDNENT